MDRWAKPGRSIRQWLKRRGRKWHYRETGTRSQPHQIPGTPVAEAAAGRHHTAHREATRDGRQIAAQGGAGDRRRFGDRGRHRDPVRGRGRGGGARGPARGAGRGARRHARRRRQYRARAHRRRVEFERRRTDGAGGGGALRAHRHPGQLRRGDAALRAAGVGLRADLGLGDRRQPEGYLPDVPFRHRPHAAAGRRRGGQSLFHLRPGSGGPPSSAPATTPTRPPRAA